MTAVLVTNERGEKLSVSALKYEFAQSVATGYLKYPPLWMSLFCMGGVLPQFVPDGGKITEVHLEGGKVLRVKETPEEVNEKMQAIRLELGGFNR